MILQTSDLVKLSIYHICHLDVQLKLVLPYKRAADFIKPCLLIVYNSPTMAAPLNLGANSAPFPLLLFALMTHVMVTFGAGRLTHVQEWLALGGLPAGKLGPDVALTRCLDSTGCLGKRTWLCEISVVLGAAVLMWG